MNAVSMVSLEPVAPAAGLADGAVPDPAAGDSFRLVFDWPEKPVAAAFSGAMANAVPAGRPVAGPDPVDRSSRAIAAPLPFVMDQPVAGDAPPREAATGPEAAIRPSEPEVADKIEEIPAPPVVPAIIARPAVVIEGPPPAQAPDDLDMPQADPKAGPIIRVAPVDGLDGSRRDGADDGAQEVAVAAPAPTLAGVPAPTGTVPQTAVPMPAPVPLSPTDQVFRPVVAEVWPASERSGDRTAGEARNPQAAEPVLPAGRSVNPGPSLPVQAPPVAQAARAEPSKPVLQPQPIAAAPSDTSAPAATGQAPGADGAPAPAAGRLVAATAAASSWPTRTDLPGPAAAGPGPSAPAVSVQMRPAALPAQAPQVAGVPRETQPSDEPAKVGRPLDDAAEETRAASPVGTPGTGSQPTPGGSPMPQQMASVAPAQPQIAAPALPEATPDPVTRQSDASDRLSRTSPDRARTEAPRPMTGADPAAPSTAAREPSAMDSPSATADPGHADLAPPDMRGAHRAPEAMAAAAAPEPPRRLSEQIAEVVRRTGPGEVEISLSPEELGKVRLSISGLDGGLIVQITAERPETLDLLRRNIEMLAREFREQGLGAFQFDFSQDGAPHRHSPQAAQPAPAETAAAPVASTAPASGYTATARPLPASASVDIRL